MKWFVIIILLSPVFLSAQTVHLNDKKIEYKGEVKLKELSQADIFNRAKTAVQNIVKPDVDISVNQDKKELKTIGVIRLPGTYPIIRNLSYSLKLSAKSGGYEYKIEDVSLLEKHRGDKGRFLSSKDLVDLLDETGPPAVEAEHVLNTIDLHLQKILRLIENKMKG